MEMHKDLIDEAIAAGRLTKRPTRRAAGDKPHQQRGPIRPCRDCQKPVRSTKGTWMAYGQRHRGWHFVNRNGTHHRCGDLRAANGTLTTHLGARGSEG